MLKAINASAASAAFPLPDDLLEVIGSYIDRKSAIDDTETQRLQDELIIIYNKEVDNKPGRFPWWIALLRLLRPALKKSQFLQYWWDRTSGEMKEHMGDQRGLASAIRHLLVEIMTFDTGEENTKEFDEAATTSRFYCDKVLRLWLEKSRVAAVTGDSSAVFLERQLQSILMAFGRMRPKVRGFVEPIPACM